MSYAQPPPGYGEQPPYGYPPGYPPYGGYAPAPADPSAELASVHAENAALKSENAALKAEIAALKAGGAPGAQPSMVPPPNLSWPPPGYGAPARLWWSSRLWHTAGLPAAGLRWPAWLWRTARVRRAAAGLWAASRTRLAW